MKASDNTFPSVLLLSGSPPANPPAGKLRLYVEGGVLKLIDSAGTVLQPGEVTQAELDALATTVAGKAPLVHSQASTTITDFTEAVQDVIAATLIGSGVTVSYNDAAGTVTITGLSTTDTEAVRDAIGVALVGVGAITVAVNDAADTITISTTATDRSTHTGTQAASSIVDLAEAVQDIVGAMVVNSATVTKTYDDTAGTLSLASTAVGGLDLEAVQDAVAAMIVAGSNVTKTYDDTAGTLTLAAAGGGGGSSTGLWRGPWTTLALLYTPNLSAGVPAEMTHDGTWNVVNDNYMSPAFAPAPQLRNDQLANTGNHDLSFTAPAGSTQLKVYVLGAGGGTGSGTAILRNGTVVYGPVWNTSWQLQTLTVAGGDVITLRSATAPGMFTHSRWGGITVSGTPNPYMIGHTVLYLGKIWRSLVDNNAATPGADGTWVEDRVASAMPFVFSDGRSPLVAGGGTLKVPNTTGRTLTLRPVRIDVSTAPTGAALIVDVNKNGTTIFTTQANRPQCAVSAVTGTSATPDVTSWAAGETLTVDIDQIGSTVAGGGLTVTILAEG